MTDDHRELKRLIEYPDSFELAPEVPDKAERLARELYAPKKKKRAVWRWVLACAVPCLLALCIALPLLPKSEERWEPVTDVLAFAAENDFYFRYLDDSVKDPGGESEGYELVLENRAYRTKTDELAYFYQQADILYQGEYFYKAEIFIVRAGTEFERAEEFREAGSRVIVDGIDVRYRIEKGKISRIYARFSEGGADYYLRFETSRAEEELLDLLDDFFGISDTMK